MPPSVPAIRIWPMSDQLEGFKGLSIERVQTRCFLKDLPGNGGTWRYPKSGLNAEPGTLVLFQFKAHIVASGVFLRDEKFEKPRGSYGGVLHFDPASFRTFDALDAAAMRAIWPGFRAFGHVKQRLNPALHGKFSRRLKNVESPQS